jgi:hypothetical protein
MAMRIAMNGVFRNLCTGLETSNVVFGKIIFFRLLAHRERPGETLAARFIRHITGLHAQRQSQQPTTDVDARLNFLKTGDIHFDIVISILFTG